MKGQVLPLLFLAGAAFGADAGKPMSFDEAIEAIVGRSTGVGAQLERRDAAANDVLTAAGAFLPSVALEAGQRADRASLSATSTTKSRSLLGVARWNLLRFGADLAAHAAARKTETAAGQELGAEAIRVEQEGVEALVAEVRLRQSTAIVNRIVEAQAESLRIARERYARGFLPRQEVEKVEVDLENARARLRGTEIEEAEARARLVSLLGEREIVPEWPWIERFGTGRAAKAPFDFREHPAWMAARSREESAALRVSQYKRLLFPSLDASFSYGHTRVLDASEGITGWAGTLILSVPLFNRFADVTAYRARGYDLRVAEYAREQAERDARREWEAASRAFSTALESARARDRTLDVSRRLYDDNLRRFRSGRASANDLAVDQARLADSELLAVAGWADAHAAFARLCHARGRRVAECRE